MLDLTHNMLDPTHNMTEQPGRTDPMCESEQA